MEATRQRLIIHSNTGENNHSDSRRYLASLGGEQSVRRRLKKNYRTGKGGERRRKEEQNPKSVTQYRHLYDFINGICLALAIFPSITRTPLPSPSPRP